MGRRRREIVLAALASVIVAVAVYRVRSVSPAADAAEHARVADVAAKQHAKALTELDLQKLNAPRPEPVDSSRDPFRFKPKPPPPAPPQPLTPQPTTQSAGPPPPAPIPLKFIGIVEGKQPGRVAVLSDARGVYYGHEGEIVEGRYRILRIGVESIDLAYVDGRGRQTIRQTGQ